MTLTRQLLEEQIVAYASEENQYTEEKERLSTLPIAFEDGSWTIDDLEWIIQWKVGKAFEKPTLRHLRSNSNEQIREAIKSAVEAVNVGKKVNALTSLKGIGVPVASAILLFIDPERFTVIDVRAWRVLRDTGYLPQSLSEDPTTDEYLLYLGSCWTLANEYNVELRTLDMALWTLGDED